MKTEIAIVTGGRDYVLDQSDHAWLEEQWRTYEFRILVHGGALGADQGVARWALRTNLCVLECRAHWEIYGDAAGPRRNHLMAWGCANIPTILLAFPGAEGTRNMKLQADHFNIPIIQRTK